MITSASAAQLHAAAQGEGMNPYRVHVLEVEDASICNCTGSKFNSQWVIINNAIPTMLREGMNPVRVHLHYVSRVRFPRVGNDRAVVTALKGYCGAIFHGK